MPPVWRTAWYAISSPIGSMPIAIFHHCVLRGPRIPSEDHAIAILNEQMVALRNSGLSDEADEIYIGVNGTDSDSLTVMSLSPDLSMVVTNGSHAMTEIPTLKMLRGWLPYHLGWRVLYTHSKGASYPPDNTFPDRWRRCMEKGVVWNWRGCMEQMDRGIESCGCHWLTPERWGSMVKTPFWGGTFWWATSDYLATLPPLPEDTFENRYEAESWIGRGPRRPTVADFHPEWPGGGC
jgi:hypothetical protein